jgi:hypothetical protein
MDLLLVATKSFSPPSEGGQLKCDFAEEFSASSQEMLLIGKSDLAGSGGQLFF